MSENALITVTSLPDIQENLRLLRERWEQKATDAASMVCTEETVQDLKKMRQFGKLNVFRLGNVLECI